MTLTLPHLHLLLNHFPTIGFIIGMGVFLIAFLRNNDDLKRASLEVFYMIALLTLPTYLSGVAAADTLKRTEGVSQTAIATHHDAAMIGYLFMLITGLLSWLALWQFRRLSRHGRATLGGVFLMAVITIAFMARAANIGSEIRHPEILSGGPESVGIGPAWFTAASVAGLVVGKTWVWPASEAVHFVGLFLLFGVVLLVNLRMLGLMRSVPFSAFHRLLPWGILGFSVNTITGMLFFIAAPQQYVHNVTFYWKMGFVMIAGVAILYQTVFDDSWSVGAGDDAPFMAKFVAASSIALWIAVIYCGQMLPFLGNAF